MSQSVINVILCGGFGSRLWPLSRENYPKPLLPIFNNESLLSLTLKRHQNLVDHTIIVTNAAQVKNMQAEVEKYGINNVEYLVESVSKNTAPAIALAALAAPNDAILVVTPSDHYIPTIDTYCSDMELAISNAKKSNQLWLFGISPNGPSTEYGYIETDGRDGPIQGVRSFHEKPTKDVAQAYSQNPNMMVNSGIFCFSKETFLNELTALAPDLFAQCQDAAVTLSYDGVPVTIDEASMSPIKKISIDYAMMEKSSNIGCIKAGFEWSDCGAFTQLIPFLETNGPNYCEPKTSLIASHASNNVVFGTHRPIALHDVHNVSVIDTDDVIMVANRDSEVPFSDLIDTVKQQAPRLSRQDKWEIRPWGRFNVLTHQDGYKVKKITVNPGGTLSLQSHKHRQEHWVVVSGLATVEVDDVQSSLTSGESILIPLGSKHRLSNNGSELVIIIETQIGDYLGEDDITRYEDAYGRNK